MNYANILIGLPYLKAHHTGSSFICDPPVLNTDIDILVLVKDRQTFIDIASETGWELGVEAYGAGPLFSSMRAGRYNLIITDKREFFYRFLGATYVSKLLNLKEKHERIEMFQCIVDYADLGWDL